MSWHKRGRLLAGFIAPPWACTHAALPATTAAPDGTLALYFSPRDEHGRAHVARARLRVEGDRLEVAEIEPRPVLGPGRLGAFDDTGVTVSCVVPDGDRTLLYYTGWTLARTVPFLFFAGLAVSVDGGETFFRVSEAPILGRSAADPFLTASPCVLREGDRWLTWYVSCVEWEAGEPEPRHRYNIRRAESADGVTWERDGRVAVDFADPSEYAFGRPCVARDPAGGYRMWTCVRGERYQLATAVSPDGLAWERRPPPPELAPSGDGWDAEMLAYPWLVEAGEARHLLYNGNGYGRTGIGYATEVAHA